MQCDLCDRPATATISAAYPIAHPFKPDVVHRLVPLADVSDLFNTMPAHDRVRLIVHCVPWAMEQYGPVYDRLIEIGGDL